MRTIEHETTGAVPGGRTGDRTGTPESIGGGVAAARGFRWLVGVSTVLVFVQAILAGRGWFITPDLLELHGYLGSLTFVIVIGQLGLAFVAWRRGVLGIAPAVLSALLLLLVTSQLGLGYAGRESAAAASWHIPNGVLIFGVLAGLLGQAGGRRVGY
ncbi:MAG: hypothetical protein M3462_03590 [Chloroflexota bacterium]|nr:hypothetical protein [Chloroflexota bacterium]